MGELSIWHWLVVLIVVMLLFGSGKVSTLMGDVAKGIKAFKHNMQESEAGTTPPAPPAPEPPAALSAAPPEANLASAERVPVHHEA